MKDYTESNTIWTVCLNNKETVYQDDHRDIRNNSWLTLKEYCNKNNLYITNMSISFRNNVHVLPSDADGYYFAKGVRGFFGYKKNINLFFVGTLQNGVLEVSSWKVPELLKDYTEIRNLQDKENHTCLIKKNTNLFMGQQNLFEEINI
jgi:hypothetical protein